MEQNLKTRLYSFVIFILTICPLTFAMTVNLQGGELFFKTPEISFENGRPGINLFVSNEKTPLEWIPESRPKEFETYRLTVLGDKGIDHSFVWTHPDGYRLEWTVFKFADRPGLTLRASFTNDSNKPVALHNFILVRSDSQSLKAKGDPATWWLDSPNFYTRRIGNLKQVLPSEKKLKEEKAYFGREFYEEGDPRYEDGRYRTFRDGITLYKDNGLNKKSPGLMMHAVGPGVSDIRFDMCVDNGTIMMSIVSSMDNILVDPGETRCSEECMILAEPYHDASLTMYKWIAKSHGAKLDRGPIYGWCSWYGPCSHLVNDDGVKIADAVKKYRKYMPLNVIQLDDNWQEKSQYGYGVWTPDEKKFPNGFGPTISAINEVGAIPGIWIAPNRVTSGYAPKDWNVGYAEGTPRLEYIDPTQPDVEEHIREAVGPLYRAGFRYYKFDFNHMFSGRSNNPKMTRMQVMRYYYKILREEVSWDSYVLACTSNLERCLAGYVDAMRIGSDVPLNWNRKYCSDGIPFDPIGISECIRSVGKKALANGVLFYNDPDVSYANYGRDICKTWHSYVGLLGGTMMVSEKLFDEEGFSPGKNKMRMMEISHPPAPEKAWSMRGGVDLYHQQFGFTATRPYGNFACVLLCNHKDTVRDIEIDNLYIEPVIGNKYYVWSFWDEKFLGTAGNGFKVKQIPAHNAALLRLTSIPEKEMPVLIGSNLHIAMGSAEIQSLTADSNGLKIDLLPSAGALNGRLYIHSKKPIDIDKVTGMSAFVVQDQENVYTVVLNDRDPYTDQKLVLKITDVKPKTKEMLKNDKKYSVSGFQENQ
jgi:hypothetical protein